MNSNNIPLVAYGTNIDEEKIHAKYAALATSSIVEIGVLNGHTSRILLENNKDVWVIGVDPLIPDSMNPDLIGNKEEILKINYEYFNYCFYNDYSYNVVNTKIPDDSISYLFIDGDHLYDAVRQDFEQWLPKVRIGGFIGLHDSCMKLEGGQPYWPGPSQLALELVDNAEIRVNFIEACHALSIFQRIK